MCDGAPVGGGAALTYFSVALLRLWQMTQSGCQLLRSQNKPKSPLCGWMWSTTIAICRLQ